LRGPTSKGGEGKGEGMRSERGGRGRRKREGRGGLSGNVAEEAFCLKSAPGFKGADATRQVSVGISDS